ncbi:hypothetical protein BKG82_26795 [Mycobacteroides chelonae]|uniref:PPE family domain-containing protein n=1 Tax=Mycobacteroides chelonae TaxID=1774 RepID=A0A1S1LKZ4_MYCCH|nr:hypothetical protein [Mycobacteroides chelonae]OHU47264.1 hypothetical protein BKG82_26795 [Mycobacteroides chelonae]
MGKHSVNPEDWYQRDHEAIYKIAQGFDSGKVTSTSQTLNQIAEKLHSIMNTSGQKVQGIILSDWRGQAAEKAQEGFSGLFKRSNSTVETTRQIANVLPALGHAMDAAKAAIEPPVSQVTAMAVAGANSSLLAAANMARMGEQQHAQYQMTSLFSQPAVDTSHTVEDVPGPPQVGGRNQDTNYGVNNSINGSVGSKSLGQVGDQISDLDRIGKTSAAFDQGAQGQGNTAGQGTGAGGQGPGQGSGSGAGAGSGAPGGLPSSMGALADRGRTRAAANGLDDGYFSRNNSILQDPLGRNNDKWVNAPKSPFGQDRIDGAPGTGRSGAAPGAGVAGMGGARGAGPMGMMPVNGRGGRGEDEKDHKIPKELINQDNTDELIGQLRSASPAVIGQLTPEEIKFQKEQEDLRKEQMRAARQQAEIAARQAEMRKRGARFSEPTPDWLKKQ